MTAYFYPYGCNNHGFFVQTDNFTKVIPVKNAKKFALENCDLRHPILNKSEYFDCLVHDIKGRLKTQFEIMANTGLYVFK